VDVIVVAVVTFFRLLAPQRRLRRGAVVRHIVLVKARATLDDVRSRPTAA